MHLELASEGRWGRRASQVGGRPESRVEGMEGDAPAPQGRLQREAGFNREGTGTLICFYEIFLKAQLLAEKTVVYPMSF